MKIIIPSVVIIFFLFITNSFAAVLFEDNFDNQADWEPVSSSSCSSGDCSSVVPSGWSYFTSMGEFNTPGVGDHYTVNISNENYRGTSGKAYTIWTESGTASNWNTDSKLMKVLANTYTELYSRIYIKLQPGWQWDSPSDGLQKIFEILWWDGTGSIYEFFPTGNSAPIAQFQTRQSATYGFNFDYNIRCADQVDNYYCGAGGLNESHTAMGTFAAVGNMGDGEWHCLEMRVKLNTYTTQWNIDGEWEVWWDGVSIANLNTIMWQSSGTARGWNTIGIGGNIYNHYSSVENRSEQWYVIDDVVVATSYIGPDYVIGGQQQQHNGGGSPSSSSGAWQ